MGLALFRSPSKVGRKQTNVCRDSEASEFYRMFFNSFPSRYGSMEEHVMN